MRALAKLERAPGLTLTEVKKPEVGHNDVLIRIRKTAICGTDIHIYNWDAWAQKTIPVPLVIGHEFVGEIVEVGSNVSDFHPGDVVSGEGHVVCGRCRNCMAGRRHLCKDTQGIVVNRPGAFAESVLEVTINGERLASPLVVRRDADGTLLVRAEDLKALRIRTPANGAMMVNGQRYYRVGKDIGANVSFDGGRTWSTQSNQPTAQMYRVSTDNDFPYRVCSGQQESGSACVASRGNDGQITFREWHPVAVEEYGYAVPDPLDPTTFGADESVPAGENQPFWITVHVPSDAAAGDYTATLTIEAQSRRELKQKLYGD